MSADERNELDHDTIQSDRRGFLIRNVLAIGAVAATALADARPARAGSLLGGIVDLVRDLLGQPSSDPTSPSGDTGSAKCFLRGTEIRTLDGDRRIEDLVVGDVLPTLFGGTCSVQWVGRYAYKKSDAAKPWQGRVRPIRIARSALAPNVPSRDLFVTSWHCLYLDGLLVPAGHLVNGTTIAAYPADELDELEYFHVKLESHDVIYAEGAACETLLSVGESASNFAEYYRRYGQPEAEETPCAPLVCYEGRRGQIASRLRSAVSPWLDRRTELDILRDRLEERGLALAAQPA